ncbi:hypothetical protein IFM89_018875 [Coptis chinensis]|uniref:Uncharacterized protein n=1 Tax=Coptis chinensis TaxID=261450 RepID=A0A835LN13_9MAGN|nr:hypothetical protein IFM89_018875 [Coptis chinensis]
MAINEEEAYCANVTRNKNWERVEAGGEEHHDHDHHHNRQVIRWERFLPKRVLRVLLVENDDSTRHIVSALLRNCSYQVIAVADGIKAWEVLQERNYKFDLVLTEVVVPSLSGINLLSQIMSNEISKNIPVIMMSSHDSISIVWKCMQIGASDFLVKPVRKNELRNLWQHVWRKHCSNKCENGNLERTKLEAGSDNNKSAAASNHGSSNAANRVESADSSSDGESCDTQSACSKPKVCQTEFGQTESIRNLKGCSSFLEEADANIEMNGTYIAKVEASSIHDMGQAKDKSMDIEFKLTLSIHKVVNTEKVCDENRCSVRSSYRDDHPESMKSKEGDNISSKPLDQNNGTNVPPKLSNVTATSRKVNFQGLGESEKLSHVQVQASNTVSSPLFGLSLRSQLKSQNEEPFQAKHVLKHSEASAFTRYGNTRSCLPYPDSSSASLWIKTNGCGGSKCSSEVNGNPPFRPINMSSTSHIYGGEACVYNKHSSGNKKEDAYDYHSSVERAVSHPIHFGVAASSVSLADIPFQSLSAEYGAILRPFPYPQPSGSLCGPSAVTIEAVVVPPVPSTDNCNQDNDKAEPVNYLLHYGNHLSQPLVHGMEHVQSICNTIAEVDQNGNCGTTIASDRNGSYEDTGDGGYDAGVALERVNKDGVHNVNTNWSDCDRSRREAALIKFRLKRKDRCFEKKVRYHNRKKLAEQRPRMKGQFVCQALLNQPL